MMLRRTLLKLLGSAPAVGLVPPSAAALTSAEATPRFALVHRECGKVAFFLKRRPRYGELLRSSDVLTLTGKPMPPYSRCVCGACGQNVAPMTADIRESRVV